MRFAFAILAVSAVLGGCGLGLPSQPTSGAWPPPVFGGGAASWPPPAAPKETTNCAERLTEPACKQATQCRWLGEYKRNDGTLASSHCAGA